MASPAGILAIPECTTPISKKTAIRCLYGNSLLKNYATTVNVVYNSELLLNQQYGKLLSNKTVNGCKNNGKVLQ